MNRRSFITASLGIMAVSPESRDSATNLQRAALLAVKNIDDACTSECWMGMHEIDCICEAREALAKALGLPYNDETNRYTEADDES